MNDVLTNDEIKELESLEIIETEDVDDDSERIDEHEVTEWLSWDIPLII